MIGRFGLEIWELLVYKVMSLDEIIQEVSVKRSLRWKQDFCQGVVLWGRDRKQLNICERYYVGKYSWGMVRV